MTISMITIYQLCAKTYQPLEKPCQLLEISYQMLYRQKYQDIMDLCWFKFCILREQKTTDPPFQNNVQIITSLYKKQHPIITNYQYIK